MNSYLLSCVGIASQKEKNITAVISGSLKSLLLFLKPYRKIFNTERILKKTLEWNCPACNSSVSKSSTALYAGKTSIATEAVLTDAIFQISTIQLC